MNTQVYTATNTARMLARSTGLVMAIVMSQGLPDIIPASDIDLDCADIIIYPSGKVETLQG